MPKQSKKARKAAKAKPMAKSDKVSNATKPDGQPKSNVFMAWLQDKRASYRKWREERDKTPRYKTFRLQKRIKPDLKPLPNSFELLKDSLKFLWQHKWTFLKISLIYALFYIFILRSPIQPNMDNIKESIRSVVGNEQENSLQGNFITASMVLTTGTTQQNDVVAGLVTLVMSLVYVWAIRHLYNGYKIKARDAYYQGLTTMIPTTVLILYAAMQLLPFALASFMYSVSRATGVFVTGVEDLGFFIFVLLIGLLTGYVLTASVMALYASTLPGMYPSKALREAKKLVHLQRLRVFRRMIALPIVSGVIYLLLLLLVIRLAPGFTFLFAEISQFIILPFAHIYLYRLYRALM